MIGRYSLQQFFCNKKVTFKNFIMLYLIMTSTTNILAIFCLLLAVALAQSPCDNLVDGAIPNTQGLFSDPTYVNGQSFGRFSYNFSDYNGNTVTGENKAIGFVWPWESRDGLSSGNSGGGFVPLFHLDSVLQYSPAPGYNGWEWSNGYSGGVYHERRTCGLDNETFTDGPAFMQSDNAGWDYVAYPLYNLTFWQKAYVPSSPTANWARIVHYIYNPGAKSIYINYHATTYTNPEASFTNPATTNRYIVLSDMDQGVEVAYVPMSINYMGQNARLKVTTGHSFDCTSHGWSSNFYLAPGQTVGIMMVMAMGMNITHVTDTAKWIDTNPAEIFAKLDDDDISAIMNWDACAAGRGSKVSIQVSQSDKCSASSAKIDISTTGTALTGDITHRVLNAAGEVVASDLTTSTTLTQAGEYTLESWWMGCIVKRTPFTAYINDAVWNSNTGEFTGSNDPYKFVSASGNSITITDKNGCQLTGTFGSRSNTPVAVSTPDKKSSGETNVPAVVFSAATVALAYLF